MKTITLTSAAIIFLSFTATSSAQIYKWVDDNGQLHYTERPAPAGKKAEPIEDKIRSAAALRSKTKAKGSSYLPFASAEPTVESSIDEQKSLAEEISAKQKKAQDNYREQLEKYCSSQKSNLKLLNTSSPITWEENGKTQLLTGQQKKDKMTEISSSISKNCSSKKTTASKD